MSPRLITLEFMTAADNSLDDFPAETVTILLSCERLVTKRGGWRYGVSTMRYPIRVSTRGATLHRQDIIYLFNQLFFGV